MWEKYSLIEELFANQEGVGSMELLFHFTKEEYMEEMTEAYRILLGKGEGKKPCETQRSRRDG
jgi:hypothetical protein